jgi:hypothetical protein
MRSGHYCQHVDDLVEGDERPLKGIGDGEPGVVVRAGPLRRVHNGASRPRAGRLSQPVNVRNRQRRRSMHDDAARHASRLVLRGDN